MAEKKIKNKNGIFAAVGAATGLGNAFRFPALCVSYGAAFVFAYVIALSAVCYPLLVAEFKFGIIKLQGKAAKIWSAILRAAAVNSAVIALYYGVIAAKLSSACLSFAVFGGTDGIGFSPVFCLCGILVTGVVFLILRRAPRSLNFTGKLSVFLSLALFAFLSVNGVLRGGTFSSFDASVLCCGSVWADALGQALLSVSLAAGIMPDFARAQPHIFSPHSAAFKIIAANLIGCLLSTLSTLPYITHFPQTVGITCALAVYQQVISAVFSNSIAARIFGVFTFGALSVVAVHSLCSLARPALMRLSRKFKFASVVFAALSMLLMPLFMLNNFEILSSCDMIACSVCAVIIALSECLFFASQRHIRGVTGFFVRFICPFTCGCLAFFSLCSARFSCFSSFANVCAYICLLLVCVSVFAPRLTLLLKRCKIKNGLKI